MGKEKNKEDIVLKTDDGEIFEVPVENPEETSEQLVSFLNLQLDNELMAESVLEKLYRNKK